jgi:hypothetical protein
MTLENTDTSAFTKKIDLLVQPGALFSPPGSRDITLREIHSCERWRQFNHPNVCYYQGVRVEKGIVISLVFDRYDVDLQDMLYNGHAINIPKYIQDIKSGIEYIHSQKRMEIMPVSGAVAASDQNLKKDEQNEDEDEMDTSW